MKINSRFTRNGNATSMIVCTKETENNEMSELKKAMHCRRWEICKKCDDHEACKSKKG